MLFHVLPPKLALATADGKRDVLSPAKDRRATVVFVVLAECPIARGFSPEMARLCRDYGSRGVRFVMAFVDGKPSDWRSQMKAYGLPFTGVKADRKLVDLLKATTAPTAAIVGARGQVPYVGRIDDRYPTLGVQRAPRRHDLRLALDAFLAGKVVIPARTPVVGCVLPSG